MNRRSLLKKAGFAALAAPFLGTSSSSNRAAAQTDSVATSAVLSLQGPFMITDNDSGGLKIIAPVGADYSDIDYSDLQLGHQGVIETGSSARAITCKNQSLKLTIAPNPSAAHACADMPGEILTLPQGPSAQAIPVDFTADAYFTLDVPWPHQIIPSPSHTSHADVTQFPFLCTGATGCPSEFPTHVAFVWFFDQAQGPVQMSVTDNSDNLFFYPDFSEDEGFSSYIAPTCSILRLRLIPLDSCPRDQASTVSAQCSQQTNDRHAEAVTTQMLRMIGWRGFTITFPRGCKGSSDDCRAAIIRARR